MLPRITALTHDHLDGSAAMADCIEALYAIEGKPFPFASIDDWIRYFKDPHVDLVKKFDTVTSVLQTGEALQMAAQAYVRHRALEGYKYVEVKFAPQYHTRGGLTMHQVVARMCEALWVEAYSQRIKVLPHVCIGREASPEVGEEIARIVLSYDGEVVLDMACDEAGHPPEKHLAAYQMTFGTRVKRDCHAGEFVSLEPVITYRQRLLKNVRTAVQDLRCHGVGHAIPLIDDPELVREVVDRGVRISGCPLSNLACGVINNVRELGIGQLLDAGVIYTLNADDDLFLPPMTKVLKACDAAYAFTREQVNRLERISRKDGRFAGFVPNV